MFIGLNGQRLLIDSPAGPEKYTYHIYQALAEIDRKNKYVVYFSKAPSNEYFQKLSGGNPNFSYRVLVSKISWTQKALSKQLFKDRPDIFFNPVHTLPIFRPSKTKYISMVHGLEYRYIKAKNPVRKFLLGKPEKYTCKNSDFLIVPSQGTKDEILKKQWASENNMEVTYEGVDDRFYGRSIEEIELVRQKYKLNSSEYFLFIGTVHPRKNLPATIRAFAQALKDFSGKNVSFAISGKLGWSYDESLNAAKKYGVDDKVFYLGRVADGDLPAMISGAVALVNFSLEEGFGLPLLEAMACRTRCLVSDIPPFREVCGDFATYVNPGHLEEMERGFVDVYRTTDSEIIAKAKERSKMFSWEESAKNTLTIFERVFKNL